MDLKLQIELIVFKTNLKIVQKKKDHFLLLDLGKINSISKNQKIKMTPHQLLKDNKMNKNHNFLIYLNIMYIN